MTIVRRPKHGPQYSEHPTGSVLGIFYVEGKRVFRALCKANAVETLPSGRKRTPKQASTYLQQLWDEKAEELRTAHEQKVGPNRTIKELMQAWIEVSQALKKQGTVDYYVRTANEYLKAVPNHPIGEFSLKQVDRFIIALKKARLSDTSINIRLKTLKTFLRWAHDRGEMERVPRIKMLPVDRKIPRVLSDEELARLFDRIARLKNTAANGRQRRVYLLHERFLMVAAATGARAAEVFWLPWEQIDLEAGRIAVLVQTRYSVKERREKVLRMPEYLRAYLGQQREEFPDERYLLDDGQGELAYAGPDALTLAFRRHLEALGLKGRGIKPIHGLRAKWISDLYKGGIDLQTIQRGAGHSSPLVTALYLSDPDTRMDEAMKVLERNCLRIVEGRSGVEKQLIISAS